MTISQLKAEALKQLGWDSTIEAKDITFSLNKKDSVGDDEHTLTAIGICAGDVLWVLPPTGNPSVQSISKPTESDTLSKEPQNTVEQATVVETSTGTETVLQSVMNMLQRACTESGLEEIDSMDIASTSIDMASIEFTIPESCYLPQEGGGGVACLQFVCTLLGAHVMSCSSVKIKHGNETTSTFGVSFALPVATHISQELAGFVVRDEKSLMTVLKSNVCAPSMVIGAAALGRSMRLAVTSLPEEIINRILLKLDLQELVTISMTSRSLKSMASSNAVWSQLYRKTFGRDPLGGIAETRSVKEIFKLEWERRRRVRQNERRHMVGLYDVFPEPVQPRGFPPMLNPQYGFMGGNADRLPFDPATFRPGFGGNRRHPSSRFDSDIWRFM